MSLVHLLQVKRVFPHWTGDAEVWLYKPPSLRGTEIRVAPFQSQMNILAGSGTLFVTSL